MKNITVYSILFCLLAVSSCTTRREKYAGSSITELPKFEFLLIDSATIIDSRNIVKGKPSIFIYFRTDCDHCQEETLNVIKNIDSLKDINIYFLTASEISDLRGFEEKFKLSKYKNIVEAVDFNYSFYKIFKPTEVPYTVIYNSDKRLIKVVIGSAHADKLLALVRTNG